MKTTALKRTIKTSNSNTPQPVFRFTQVPKDRKGWSSGEWAGFYAALRARP